MSIAAIYKPPCIMREYIVNGDLNGNVTGAWIKTHDYRVAIVTAQWAGTSTPNGTFIVQGTGQDPNETASPTTYNYPVTVAILTTATIVSSVITVNSASAGDLSVTFEPTHPWIRLIYTRTGGGAADTLQAQITLKD